MGKRSLREARRARRRKQRLTRTLIWGGAGVVVLAAIGYLVWIAVRPAAGESFPILPADHIAEGTPPGPYNSDPPTSGPHYGNSLPGGFYEEADLANLPPNPEGYLVHNLEHGYVIFWYNCNLLDEAGCEGLKSQIRSVMDDFDNFKLVAFPWSSIDVPVAMTSWGQMQRFDKFSASQAASFIRNNRNRAPEPNAP